MLGKTQFVIGVSQAIGSVMVFRMGAGANGAMVMRAVFLIVKAEIEGAGAQLAQLKRDMKNGRKCAECGATMKLDSLHTCDHDFWTCPKCGYWDCTKHIVRV